MTSEWPFKLGSMVKVMRVNAHSSLGSSPMSVNCVYLKKQKRDITMMHVGGIQMSLLAHIFDWLTM